jgi:hypothetical protein
MKIYIIHFFKSGLLKILFITVILSAFISSCEKGPVFNEFYDPVDYFPLEAGNYWIYESSYTTTAGTVTDTGKDTIRVTGDTTIYGTHYYRVEGSWFGGRPYNELLRYVLGERVSNPQGKIWYHGSEFEETLNSYASFNGRDTAYSERFYMFNPVDSVEISLGTFKTVALKGVYRSPLETDEPTMISEWHYAKDIGLIKGTTDYINDEYIIEMELIEYFLK